MRAESGGSVGSGVVTGGHTSPSSIASIYISIRLFNTNMKNFKKSLVSSPFPFSSLLISFPSFVVKTPILQKTNPLNNPQRHPQPPPPPRHYPFSPPHLANLPFRTAPGIMEATTPFYHKQPRNLLARLLNLLPHRTVD